MVCQCGPTAHTYIQYSLGLGCLSCVALMRGTLWVMLDPGLLVVLCQRSVRRTIYLYTERFEHQPRTQQLTCTCNM